MNVNRILNAAWLLLAVSGLAVAQGTANEVASTEKQPAIVFSSTARCSWRSTARPSSRRGRTSDSACWQWPWRQRARANERARAREQARAGARTWEGWRTPHAPIRYIHKATEKIKQKFQELRR